MVVLKLTAVLLTFFTSYQLCISEEICSVIEKKDKDFKPCIFPFIYEGVKYNNCTDVNDPDGKPWCSTKVDEDGNHVQYGGNWGHCGQDCNKDNFQQKAELSISSFSPDFSKCGENNDPHRIFQSTAVGLWPWIASLGFWSDGEWNHRCGATLVSQTKIITAAHCALREDDLKERWRVRLGDFNLASKNDDQNVQESNINEIFQHPSYVVGKAYNDIAVLIITPVDFTIHVRPICLPKPSTFTLDEYKGDTSTLIGWGSQTLNGKPSESLKRTIVTIYDYSYCNVTHENISGKAAALVKQYLPELFQPNLLCAGYESAEQGSCQGDSGGPLMVFNTKTLQYFQVGMVAGAVSSCGDKDIPGYYTRLDYPDIADFVEDPEFFHIGEVIEYTDHNIFLKYKGKIDNGLPSGKGTMIYKNGDKYEGEWKNGKREGPGTVTVYKDETNGSGTYSGNWKDDEKSGNGTFIWKSGKWSGDKYDGEWDNNLINGFGKYFFANGNIYEGQWKDGKQSGNGTFIWKSGKWSGDKYNGEWDNDLINGFGKYFFADGNIYEGQWKYGKKSGNGMFIWTSGEWSGDKYVGEWENDLQNGFGKYYSANGNIYEGQWKDHKRSGNGTFILKDGSKYVGEWENDWRNGFGIEYSSNGDIATQGQWKEGTFISK